tara:strand:+ start:885 stop:1580 length:696 start_codon:yes stop_codon:yes gene_type:complete
MFKTTTKKDEKLIIEKFNRIKNKGFVKGVRKGDSNVGLTFEKLLGVKENCKQLPDFNGFEIKTKRNNSSSLSTLFSKAPLPKGSNPILRWEYGITYQDFKVGYYNGCGTYQVTVDVCDDESKIKLNVIDVNSRNVCCDNIYWGYSDLENSIRKKMKSLIYINAESKIINGKEHFHYNNAKIFYNPNIYNFIELIRNNTITIQMRFGNNDHGTAFRIPEKKLHLIYDKIVEI